MLSVLWWLWGSLWGSLGDVCKQHALLCKVSRLVGVVLHCVSDFLGSFELLIDTLPMLLPHIFGVCMKRNFTLAGPAAYFHWGPPTSGGNRCRRNIWGKNPCSDQFKVILPCNMASYTFTPPEHAQNNISRAKRPLSTQVSWISTWLDSKCKEDI